MWTFKTRIVTSVFFVVALLAAGMAWGLGFGLGESKEQLQMEYDVTVQDHGTGRVTVTLTLADEGRLAPLRSVDLVITPEPGDQTRAVDLSVSLAAKEVEGKQVYYVHLNKALVQRATIQLTTGHLDGESDLLTWYYHPIKLADYIGKLEQQDEPAAEPAPSDPAPDAPPAAPATER